VNTAERSEAQAALGHARKAVEALEALLAATPAPTPKTAPAPLPAPAKGISDPTAFFNHVRAAKLLGESLSEAEVQGCNAILTACAGIYPASWTAYALATAWLETAGTMQPIKEYGGAAYFRRMYDIEGDRPAKAKELGNLTPGDGAKYAGRGFVQLTGRANYQRAQEKLGKPLVTNPDLAMEPAAAAAIMVGGMKEAWFTGKALNDFIPAEAGLEHFKNARRIINGTDRALDIAKAAMTFQDALKAGGWR